MINARAWLQRKLGPSPEVQERIAELTEESNRKAGRIIALVTERDHALRDLRTEQEAHRKTTQSLNLQINRLLEPDPSEECRKIRLRDLQEAKGFLADLAERTGKDPAMLQAYACRVCPRHPLTRSRIWHVGHATTAEAWAVRERSKRDHGQQVRAANEAGTSIGARLSPEVLARLRNGQD